MFYLTEISLVLLSRIGDTDIKVMELMLRRSLLMNPNPNPTSNSLKFESSFFGRPMSTPHFAFISSLLRKLLVENRKMFSEFVSEFTNGCEYRQSLYFTRQREC